MCLIDVVWLIASKMDRSQTATDISPDKDVAEIVKTVYVLR